jgi:hypothetical protein
MLDVAHHIPRSTTNPLLAISPCAMFHCDFFRCVSEPIICAAAADLLVIPASESDALQ